MAPDTKQKWDDRYASGSHGATSAVRVLQENLHLLPQQGQALDMACGTGTNALILAGQGLHTHAWDISEVALERLSSHAHEKHLKITCQQRDVIKQPPEANTFDVIVVSRFLERPLIPHLIKALKADGLIFYQTFIVDKVDKTGPSTKAYRLEKNELLAMFRSLRLLLYREEGSIGHIEQGFRNEAMLIAQK